MDELTMVIIFALGSFLVGLFMVNLGVRSVRGTGVSRRMREFVIEGDRTTTAGRSFQIQEVFNGSLFSRTISPAVKKIITYFGQFTPRNSIERVNHQLTIARNPYNMGAKEFYGIRLALLSVGTLMAILINYRNLKEVIQLLGIREGLFIPSLIANFRSPVMVPVYLGIMLMLAFFLSPVVWLRAKVNNIQNEIRYGMPDALDMLSVCASAGLGFDQALQRVGDYWQTPIGYEFRRVVSEMEVGVSRAAALRNMSDRVDVSELTGFVAIIIQSETMGMRIADVLHAQADQMRVVRQMRAKEIAYRLPAKMIVPLALMIMPALLAVIIGPLIPSMLELLLGV